MASKRKGLHLWVTRSPVRTRRVFANFDSVQAFSFSLASVYEAFQSPVVRLVCRECHEIVILDHQVTGKNSSHLHQLFLLSTSVLFFPPKKTTASEIPLVRSAEALVFTAE
jgi:hypothetical protein